MWKVTLQENLRWLIFKVDGKSWKVAGTSKKNEEYESRAERKL